MIITSSSLHARSNSATYSGVSIYACVHKCTVKLYGTHILQPQANENGQRSVDFIVARLEWKDKALEVRKEEE